MSSAEIDQSTQVFNLHCEVLVLMFDGWSLNHRQPRPPAEHTRTLSPILLNTVHETQASSPVRSAGHLQSGHLKLPTTKKIDKRPLRYIRTPSHPCLNAAGGTENCWRHESIQDHVDRMYSSVKQKVHAEVKCQQVFHTIWNTNLCCKTSGQRQQRHGLVASDKFQKYHAAVKKPARHWNCYDGWIKRDRRRTLQNVA